MKYTPLCPYCGGVALPTTGKEIYPHLSLLWRKGFFICRPCGAWVGTHKNTGIPLGTLANAELRGLRKKTHDVFDSLWMGRGRVMSRGRAYKKLAAKFGRRGVHIAEMGEEECKQAYQYAKEIRENNKGGKK